MTPGRGYLLVRAVVGVSIDRAHFDGWYDGHLLAAVASLRAARGWRFWSHGEEDGRVHYAMYEFGSPAALDAALESDGIASLIADFSARWGEGVHRVRSRVTVVSAVG